MARDFTDEELLELTRRSIGVSKLTNDLAERLSAARATIAAQKAELEALRGRVGLAKRLLEDAMGTNGQAHHENLIDAKDTLDGVHDDGI